MHHSLEGRGRILISSSPWNLWWPFLRGESAAIGDSTAFAEMFSLFGVSVCVCVCVCVCVSSLVIRDSGFAKLAQLAEQFALGQSMFPDTMR